MMQHIYALVARDYALIAVNKVLGAEIERRREKDPWFRPTENAEQLAERIRGRWLSDFFANNRWCLDELAHASASGVTAEQCGNQIVPGYLEFVNHILTKAEEMQRDKG